MSLLSPRLQLKVAQKQILTPGLVQMVTVLQLNRMELRDMITQEMAANPVLEDIADGTEEITPQEVQTLLENERVGDPADAGLLEAMRGPAEVDSDAEPDAAAVAALSDGADAPEPTKADPFEEIDFGSHFEEYLDPGYKTPSGEQNDKPSFETFLSAPVTLADHLQSQLSILVVSEEVRDAADAIIGNLEENGYLTISIEEIAQGREYTLDHLGEALKVVQSLDPAGVAARDLRECLQLQLESRGAQAGVAGQIVAKHLRLVETKQYREIGRQMNRPQAHIQIALEVIQHLDPCPGLRYSGAGARHVEPDVYITKDGDNYLIQLNDEDIPQLRLSGQYRQMLNRESEPNKDVRNFVKEKYASALQLIKNIEQRRHTILRVCETIIGRQAAFLEDGIDHLKPMMIKDVAEQIGVHPSTVSRAVANKYAHTPQGVFELRYFFSEGVQGPSGTDLPLPLLKRRVRKMIDEEDRTQPLTDEQITARLNDEGIRVTRRTVAKYREDMNIRSTHQRRFKPNA